MKVLDRYILRRFFLLFILMLVSVIFIYILVNFFEQLDRFVDKHVSIVAIVKYYTFQIPHLYVLFSPVGGMLAAFLSVGELARRNELLAIKSSGISVYRTLTPLVTMGILLSIVSFGINDTLVPTFQHRVRIIKEKEIEKKKEFNFRSVRRNFSFISPDGKLYFFGKIDAKRNSVSDASVIWLSKGKVTRRIDAKSGEFRNKNWVFYSVVERKFIGSKETVETYEKKVYQDLTSSPFEILKEKRRIEELNIAGLIQLIESLRNAGLDSKRETVELHIRFSFPFANLIVLLFALGLSAQMRGKGRAYAFGLAIFMAFFYWGILQATRSMAGVGRLNPIFSAWFPNLVFSSLAIATFVKLKT